MEPTPIRSRQQRDGAYRFGRLLGAAIGVAITVAVCVVLLAGAVAIARALL